MTKLLQAFIIQKYAFKHLRRNIKRSTSADDSWKESYEQSTWSPFNDDRIISAISYPIVRLFHGSLSWGRVYPPFRRKERWMDSVAVRVSHVVATGRVSCTLKREREREEAKLMTFKTWNIVSPDLKCGGIFARSWLRETWITSEENRFGSRKIRIKMEMIHWQWFTNYSNDEMKLDEFFTIELTRIMKFPSISTQCPKRLGPNLHYVLPRSNRWKKVRINLCPKMLYCKDRSVQRLMDKIRLTNSLYRIVHVLQILNKIIAK